MEGLTFTKQNELLTKLTGSDGVNWPLEIIHMTVEMQWWLVEGVWVIMPEDHFQPDGQIKPFFTVGEISSTEPC